MPDPKMSIAKNREELLGQPSDISELQVHGDALASDFDGLAVQKFSEFGNIQVLEIVSFSCTLAKLLESLNKQSLRALRIEHCNLTTSEIKAISRFENLRQIEILGRALTFEELSLICTLPLTNLVAELETLGSHEMNIIASLSTLENISLKIGVLDTDNLSGLDRSSRLKGLALIVPNPEAVVAIRSYLQNIGILQQAVYNGQIGDWYETGKEDPAREFFSPDFTRPYPRTIQRGDNLEIYSPDGATLFSGVVTYPADGPIAFYQNGVKPCEWDLWFANKLDAKLITCDARPGVDVFVSFWRRPDVYPMNEL